MGKREERRVLHHRPCHAAKEGEGEEGCESLNRVFDRPPFVFSAYVIRTQRPSPHHAHGLPLLRLFVLATSGEGKRDGDGLVFFLFLFPPKTCGRLRGCLGRGGCGFFKRIEGGDVVVVTAGLTLLSEKGKRGE